MYEKGCLCISSIILTYASLGGPHLLSPDTLLLLLLLLLSSLVRWYPEGSVPSILLLSLISWLLQ